jgi:hypothetical protein
LKEAHLYVSDVLNCTRRKIPAAIVCRFLHPPSLAPKIVENVLFYSFLLVNIREFVPLEWGDDAEEIPADKDLRYFSPGAVYDERNIKHILSIEILGRKKCKEIA